jgi:L-lactate dehydrogenase (cytochrome)
MAVTGGETRRQVPTWSGIKPFLHFEAPPLTLTGSLKRAVSIPQLRAIAKRRVPRAVFDFVDGAAEAEISLRRSRQAFERVELRPRVLRDVSEIDLSTRILGNRAAMPIVLAPTGLTRLVHHSGEPAVARAARSAGLPYALSTMGTTSPEELQTAVPDGDHWFQLYLWRDRGVSREVVARVEAAGIRTLVLTVDTPVSGLRRRDVHNGLSIPPRLTLRTLADIASHPTWWANLLTTPALSFASITSTDGSLAELANRVFDRSVTRADLEWLRDAWPGPLVVKGIQTATDAAMVADVGVDALVVSNHGGRQLDRSTTPLKELPAVVNAVHGRAEVYIDGGVLNGADVVAAIALGADGCLVGRAYLYGMMAGGQVGVDRAIAILRTEMVRTMQLMGAASLADLDGCAILPA